MQTQRNKSESAPEPEGEGAVRSSAVLAELEAARRHLCNAMDTHPSKWNSVYDWNETADMLAVIDDIVESERRHSANKEICNP